MARNEQLDADAHVDESLRAVLDQLNIALLRRLGGRVTIPASEIDATGDFDMTIKVDDETGTFTCVLWSSSSPSGPS